MTFLRVAGFSLLLVLSYTLFTNILPQVQSEPPEEEAVDLAALDVAGLIAWGERLFEGKGTCALCHNSMGRAPDLLALDLAAVFPERLADPRYGGEAKGMEATAAIETYLRESMLAPSVFVVGGFGKKGTDDTVSPMPKVDGPPGSLSSAEIDALVAFLQDRAGTKVTVRLPAAEEPAGPAKEEEEGPAATAEAVIEKLGCAACHDLEGSGADIGPNLAGIGQRLDHEGLRRAILDPNAQVAQGFEPGIMPQDYGDQMRASELELVVDYMVNLPAGETPQ
jgi:mono/diheme cytochrome c family protein